MKRSIVYELHYKLNEQFCIALYEGKHKIDFS